VPDFRWRYKDLMTSAYPVLSRHGVPFTIYVPTAFPDGVGEAWWLALEAVIACQSRLSLVMDGTERRFDIAGGSENISSMTFFAAGCARFRRPIYRAQSRSLQALFHRLAALSRKAFMDWGDLTQLAADPLVTIGSATVNYPVLSSLKDSAALREMTMGMAVAQAAFRRDVKHFAYPFGDRAAFRRQHVAMAQRPVSRARQRRSRRGRERRASNLHALPRIGWTDDCVRCALCA